MRSSQCKLGLPVVCFIFFFLFTLLVLNGLPKDFRHKLYLDIESLKTVQAWELHERCFPISVRNGTISFQCKFLFPNSMFLAVLVITTIMRGIIIKKDGP